MDSICCIVCEGFGYQNFKECFSVDINEKEKKDQLLMMAVFMEYNPKISLKFYWGISHVDTQSLKKSGLKRSWFDHLLSKKCLKFYCYDFTFSHDTYIWQPASTQRSSLNGTS